MTFLFWNLHKNRDVFGYLQNMIIHHHVDVLIVAENVIDPNYLLKKLNEQDIQKFYYQESPGCKKIGIYTRLKPGFMTIVLELDRLTIRRIQRPDNHVDLLLAALHFPSKKHWNENDQYAESARYSEQIKKAEDKDQE